LTLDAIAECQTLLEGLQGGGGSFVEITKAQKNIKKLVKKLSVSSQWGHLAKTLVEMAQEFASGEGVSKVLALFDTLEGNLHTSRDEMDRVNVEQIAVFNHFMDIS